MTPARIYQKTMIFSMLKLGIGLLTLFICMAIALLTWLIISNMAFELTTSIAIGCAGFLIAVIVYYLIMGRLGYSIKLGHLAIVERAHGGGDIPPNPVEFSKSIVEKRFGSNRHFYSYSRDIRITVGQLTRVLARGFVLGKDTPELGSGRWLSFLISQPAIRCIDECCLTYALRRRDYEVTAACVDALTILIQDWETFSKKARNISILHIITFLLIFALFFVPGITLFSSIGSILPWLAASFFIALTIKIAFLDSYVLTKISCEFLTLTEEADINPKNYARLDKWSKGYAKLRKSAEKIAEKAEDDEDKAERAAKKASKKTEHKAITDASEPAPEHADATSETTDMTEESEAETAQTENTPSED